MKTTKNNNEKSNGLTLKNDYLFKAVYGSDDDTSKMILIALLNKILDRKDNPIVKLEYKNPFQPKLFVDDKETILDIKAIADNEEIIDLEMQIVWTNDMPERLVFYTGGMIREALKEGEPYANMKTSIAICITNSVAFKQTDQFKTEFYYMEEKLHFRFSDKSRICCIELPKVNPERKPVEDLSELEVYLEYLRYAGTEEQEYVEELIRAGGKELKMAQEKFEKSLQDEVIREQALAREKALRDKISMQYMVEQAEQKAEAAEQKAEKAELAKAESDAKLGIAIRSLRENGMANDKIAAMLGLTVEEVNKIIE